MKKLNIVNKKAHFDYEIEETFEAGIVLQGWEVKSILQNKANIINSHVHIRDGELYLFNALIQPLESASTHEKAEPSRSRKLLMKRKEINKLFGLVEQKGYTLVPIRIENKKKFKLIFGLGKGKKLFDKRQSEKEKSLDRQAAVALKNVNR